MKKLVIVFALLILCTFSFGAMPQTPKAWEYKFEYKMNEKKANELGAAGWELTAIESTGPGIANNVPTYVFKRLK